MPCFFSFFEDCVENIRDASKTITRKIKGYTHIASKLRKGMNLYIHAVYTGDLQSSAVKI